MNKGGKELVVARIKGSRPNGSEERAKGILAMTRRRAGGDLVVVWRTVRDCSAAKKENQDIMNGMEERATPSSGCPPPLPDDKKPLSEKSSFNDGKAKGVRPVLNPSGFVCISVKITKEGSGNYHNEAKERHNARPSPMRNELASSPSPADPSVASSRRVRLRLSNHPSFISHCIPCLLAYSTQRRLRDYVAKKLKSFITTT
ncbi:hypothetical protein HPP92_001943 [Vanilla planifolia]|uniref:Uncharacterized protein n=1 Tax=Vanilla planifolia TaxID=51239 RepID=A0A835S8Q7_VANPL|nr:hypothetical protein HPP92_001943 [Vanilla planifolia]